MQRGVSLQQRVLKSQCCYCCCSLTPQRNGTLPAKPHRTRDERDLVLKGASKLVVRRLDCRRDV